MRWLLLISLVYSLSVQADEWPDMPFPDKGRAQIVADNMNFMGLPMKTWVLDYPGSALVVADFYEQQWKDRSEKFDKNTLNGDVIINSWQPPFLLTARIRSQYDSTLAYVGISQNLGFSEFETQSSQTFPSLSGTTVLSDISSVDLFKRGRTVVLVSERRVSESYHYYKNYYTSRGWHEVVGILEPSVNQAVLRLNRENSFLDLSIKSEQGRTHIVANEMSEGL